MIKKGFIELTILKPKPHFAGVGQWHNTVFLETPGAIRVRLIKKFYVVESKEYYLCEKEFNVTAVFIGEKIPVYVTETPKEIIKILEE